MGFDVLDRLEVVREHRRELIHGRRRLGERCCCG
jgi:hypothetical protein